MTNPVVELPKRPPPVAAAPSLPAIPPAEPVAPAIALPPLVARWEPPVFGALAAVFGIAALFKATLFLAPLALLCALVAGLRGNYGWAAVGVASAIVALATSPLFWTLLGLTWLIGWLV